MRKLYYKEKDIEADIREYTSLRRKYKPSSTEYKELSKELNWLKSKKEKLIKSNSANKAFSHDGIPRCPTRKTKPKSAKQCPKLKTFLEKEIKEAETKLITLKKQLDSL